MILLFTFNTTLLSNNEQHHEKIQAWKYLPYFGIMFFSLIFKIQRVNHTLWNRRLIPRLIGFSACRKTHLWQSYSLKTDFGEKQDFAVHEQQTNFQEKWTAPRKNSYSKVLAIFWNHVFFFDPRWITPFQGSLRHVLMTCQSWLWSCFNARKHMHMYVCFPE